MKAIALFSGGLDSMLAIKVIQEQGIEVIAVHFNIGFGSTKDRREHLQKVADQVNAELVIADVREQYLKTVLFSPEYGYGSAFNPCIDCHGNMFKWAREYMEKLGASFVISGEVLNERPMSQRMDAMKKVETISGIEGLVLRPLSAKHMDITIPEERGWVKREALLDIQGRCRDPQFSLIKKYGIEYFESPGGGCLLTEENIAIKIKDYIDHDRFEVPDIDVIKHGRHFRLPDGAKLVVGRHKEDNEMLERIENDKYNTLRTPQGLPGPLSLLRTTASEADKALAARIILSYTKAKSDTSYTITIGDEMIEASPFETKAAFKSYMLY